MARTIGVITVILALLVGTLARAQDQTPQPAPLTTTDVEAKAAELESAPGLDAVVKKQAADLLQSALDDLQRAAEFQAKAAEQRRLAADAPNLLATIRQELASPAAEPVLNTDGMSLSQLEQAFTQATADLEQARQLAADLQAETTRRNERRSDLPVQIAEVRQRLLELDDPDKMAPVEGEPPVLTEARRMALQARRRALSQELDALEAEVNSYDVRRELLPARRDRAQRRVTVAEAVVAAWQDKVARTRQQEADRAAREAQRLQREAARQHPVLKEFADETAQRAKARAGDAGIASLIVDASKQDTDLKAAQAALSEQFLTIQRRLAKSGLNRATGLLLRRQLETLPDKNLLRQQLRTTQDTLEDLEYDLLELEDERDGAGETDKVLTALLAQIPDEEKAKAGPELEAVARELVIARRDLLDQLYRDADVYSLKLIDLNVTRRNYLDQAEAFSDFIEERILWVRSVAGDPIPDLADVSTATGWLLDPNAWSQATTATLRHARSHWFSTTLGIIVVIGLWVVRARWRVRLRAVGELVSRYHTDAFYLTLVAVVLTVVLALPMALTLFFIGWILRQPANQPLVATAVGAGLQSAGLFLLPLAVLRQVLSSRGLADAHFRWPATSTKVIRRNLRWFIPVIVPIVVLVVTFERSESDAASASLGRAFFSIGLIALAFFLHCVLRPNGDVLRRFFADNKHGWIYRLRYVWYSLIVLGPLALVVITWMGFYYTAIQLELRLENSLVLAFVLVLVHAVMLRWLFIARRKVAVEDARRRREVAAAAEAKGTAGDGDQPVAFDEDKVDLPALSGQTRQLFRVAIGVGLVVGLYLTWAAALPALRMFDRMQVWPSVRLLDVAGEVAEPAATNGSQPVATANEATVPIPGAVTPTISTDSEPAAPAGELSITVADIGLSVIVLLTTWVAFRNVPGLIEIVVLQRLPLDAGSRYALSTVLRYAIAIVGVVIASNALGIPWTKVQWLAAALTFGLAFGLQEIFANFVSGLIVLAERPVRLGDTVTVGGVTGTVTRIRMRATTITDWDRKELVIPNKTFITGDVINWTLSDPVLRLTIAVGASYSSDVDLVERTLLRIAEKSANVLTDPKPQAVFKGFGDSTLDFELRVFIPSMDVLIPVRHEMNMTIFKEFRQAGIEIAFPQRDLHIRSSEEIKFIQKREDVPVEESI